MPAKASVGEQSVKSTFAPSYDGLEKPTKVYMRKCLKYFDKVFENTFLTPVGIKVDHRRYSYNNSHGSPRSIFLILYRPPCRRNTFWVSVSDRRGASRLSISVPQPHEYFIVEYQFHKHRDPQ